MYKNLIIKNFKSIYEDEIELGRINVFIGENGSGKSNILEALVFFSLGQKGDIINAEALYSLGMRATKPKLTISAFKNSELLEEFRITVDNEKIDFNPENVDDIFSDWKSLLEIGTGLGESFDDGFVITNKDLLAVLQMKDNEKIINNKFLREFIMYKQKTQEIVNYVIYCLNTKSLRGIYNESRKNPLGINGENLDVLLANFDKEERNQILEYKYLISWLEDFFIDTDDRLKLQGYKINRSQSGLYFQDKFMAQKNNIFSSENSNEGILYVLFYLALFISKRTPKFFAIDNIETCLNPHLCTETMRILCKLAKENDRQALIMTHNPAILDGLDLNDDEIRLFEVYRNDSGHTKTRRIKLKPNTKSKRKLSELWTRGFLGAISKEF